MVTLAPNLLAEPEHSAPHPVAGRFLRASCSGVPAVRPQPGPRRPPVLEVGAPGEQQRPGESEPPEFRVRTMDSIDSLHWESQARTVSVPFRRLHPLDGGLQGRT